MSAESYGGLIWGAPGAACAPLEYSGDETRNYVYRWVRALKMLTQG